jgi:hypothetical protein
MASYEDQTQLLKEADDLAKHAAKQGADRIMTIAAVTGDRRMAVMIGIKATKIMLDAFVMAGVEQAGMPREAAEYTALKVMERLMELIAQHFDKEEEAA